jgi:dienelactone hydrolase
VASNALGCLTVGSGAPAPTSGTVHLTWQGQVERARLIVGVAGTEAGHTIKVNGQPVAQVPVQPAGRLCGDGEVFYLSVPPEVVVQGDNRIEITGDALAGDEWSAVDVRLEVLGDLFISVPESTTLYGLSGLSAMAATTAIVSFTNSYDGTTQEAIVQIPDGYDATPRPLLIAVHARSGTKEKGLDWFDEEANTMGWLLASPELHGSWEPDPDCYDPGIECDYEDEVVTEGGKPGAYAHASMESQYDIIGTVEYMVEHYEVKTDRIYIAGYSMGGQGDVIIGAKYPHLFAAVFDNKGPTDMVEWYDEQADYYGSENTSQVRAMRKECHIDGDPKAPEENPFCYQRRSGIHFASNYLHVPISMTHSISDALVPIHHSRDVRDAINGYGPDLTASLYEDPDAIDPDTGDPCPDHYHCYEPDPAEVLGFLDQFTLDNTPTHVHVTSDESKSYYWMNLTQSGGDHWSQVEATYYPTTATVTATVSDSHPLTVSFNLGSTPITDTIPQPGMGLSATTYLVRGGGNNHLHSYTSGYLTTPLTTTGQFTLTVSAIEAALSAHPATVSGWHRSTSTITTVLKDRLDNPLPGSTAVQLLTSAGVFPNGKSTYTTTLAGDHLAFTSTLTLDPLDGPAEVTASVGGVTGSTIVDAIYPEVEVSITPDKHFIYSGETVTYTYRVSNTGDTALTNVMMTDATGTLCELGALAEGTAHSCSKSEAPDQTTTVTATVTGQDPLGNDVTDDGQTTVTVASPEVEITITPDKTAVYEGELVAYTYRITNTGNVTLTDVTVVDDNGAPEDADRSHPDADRSHPEDDDVLVCEYAILTEGAARVCSRNRTVTQTTTSIATVRGQDPGGHEVSDSDSATVAVPTIYLPAIVRNRHTP